MKIQARWMLFWLLIAGAVFIPACAVQASPYNDARSDAQPISDLSGSVSSNNIGASREYYEPDWTGSTLWYRWTAPTNGTVSFNTVGSSFDTTLGVYGNGYDGVYDDDSGGNYTSFLSFDVQQGLEYEIAVGGYAGAQGDFYLLWNMDYTYYIGPNNDNFSNAETISGSSSTVFGSNNGATDETGDPIGGPTIWYRWTAPASGEAFFNTYYYDYTGFYDTVLGVYTGSSLNNLTFITYNDDNNTQNGWYYSNVGFTAIAGTTYYIVVGGYGGWQGDIELNWFLRERRIGRVIGRITNTSAVAMPNVSVALSGRSTPAITNSAGYYLFDNVLEGNYTLTPSLTGYSFTPSSRSIAFQGGDLTGQNFVGVAAFVISGRITNSSGVGVPNVSVLRSGPSTPVVTNANGEYSFPQVAEGSYSITPSAAGMSFSPTSRTATPQQRVANFTALFTISGRVRLSSGSGIANVGLTLTSPSGTALTGVTNPVQTNATGQYIFRNVPAGLYYVTPRLSGYGFSPATQGLKVSTAPRAANFIGSPFYRIIGRITNSSGVALAGVSVSRSGSSTPVITNSAGYYIMTGVPAGSYTVMPSLNGYGFTPATRNITIASVDASGQNFSGYPAYTVSGRITNSNGVGIGGINVTHSGGVTISTNSSGEYSFGGVPIGNCIVTPIAAGSSFVPASRVVTPDNPTANFTVLYSVSGRVRNSANAGIANVSLTLRTPSSARPNGVTNPVITNANGEYSFLNVPAGLYYVAPTLAGYTFLPATQGLKVSNAPRAANFVGTQFFRISGRISTSSGVAVSGVTVTRSGSSTPVTTNSAGYFSFTNVPNGTYTITPGQSGATFTPASRTAMVNGADVAGQNFIRN